MPSNESAQRSRFQNRHSDPMRRFARTVRSSAVIAACLFIPQAWAQEVAAGGGGCVRGTVGCAVNTAGTMRSCSATVQCTGAPTFSIAAVTTDALNVTACLPAMATTDAKGGAAIFTLIARAMVSAPTNRNCGWAFGAPMRGGLTGAISIGTADGLPVELMDFLIEDDSEPEQDDTQPSSGR